jgi:CHASE3 domain sensor protein
LALRKEYLAGFEKIFSQSTVPEGIRLLKIAEQATTKWREANKDMMDLAKAGKKAEAQAVYIERSLRLKSELDDAMDKYSSYRSSELARIEAEQNSLVSRTNFLLIVCGLFALVVAVILGVLLSRSISRPRLPTWT